MTLARTRIVMLAAFAFAIAPGAQPANAGTLTSVGNEIRYQAAAGDADGVAMLLGRTVAGELAWGVQRSGFQGTIAPLLFASGCLPSTDPSAPQMVFSDGFSRQLDGVCIFGGTQKVSMDLGDGEDAGTVNTSLEPHAAIEIVIDAGARRDFARVETLASDRSEIRGGEGDDISLYGSAGNDTISGGPGNDDINGFASNYLPGQGEPPPASGVDLLSGNEGDDQIRAANSLNITVIGGDGNDRLWGTDGDDTIAGDAGEDVLVGWGGADALNGGSGNDRVFGDAGNDTVSGGEGDDELEGSLEERRYEYDFPSGEGHLLGDDTLDGGPGQDTLFAVAPSRPSPCEYYGCDQPVPPSGNDTFHGGSGVDRVDYSTATAAIRVSVDARADDGSAGEGDNVQLDVETVLGSSEGDTLIGSDGNDALDGRGGADLLVGGAGNDSLDGGSVDAARDTLRGGGGQDVLEGRAGDDMLEGESGDDSIGGGGGGDQLEGGEGDDVENGGPGLDTVAGGPGDDQLNGSQPALVGADGADRLRGDAGNDVLRGGEGDDALEGGAGNDSLKGESGSDTADYSLLSAAVSVTLDDRANDGPVGERDNVESDVEAVSGGSGPDTLAGNRILNALSGGAGEDYIDGERAVDELSGGEASDLLRSRDAGLDRVRCGAGVDFVIGDREDDFGRDCELVDKNLTDSPLLGRRVALRPRSGELTLLLPAMHRVVPLRDHANVPVGSTVDASRGRVALVSSGRGRRRQRAMLSGAAFAVAQRRRSPVTELRLRGGDFLRCSRPVARNRRSRPAVRRLRGSVRGRFRVAGRHGSLRSRRGSWLIVDRCDGTLFRISRGQAVVFGSERGREVILEAGESYLMKARSRRRP